MKNTFNILKPVLAYWITVLIHFILSFFEVFGVFGGDSPWLQGEIFFVVMFSVLTILTGYFEKQKNVLWGLLLLELQLVISSLLQVFYLHPNKELTVLDNIIVYSNIMYGAFFTNHNILNAAITVIFPVATTAISITATKYIKKKF